MTIPLASLAFENFFPCYDNESVFYDEDTRHQAISFFTCCSSLLFGICPIEIISGIYITRGGAWTYGHEFEYTKSESVFMCALMNAPMSKPIINALSRCL